GSRRMSGLVEGSLSLSSSASTVAAASPLPLGERTKVRGSDAPTLSRSDAPHAPKPVLIHGVTGSGKTEIYLQAIEHALRDGKYPIAPVREISLTPQTVERFRARFRNQNITVLHSNLSAGERHDQWHKIRDGQSHIVIGARSAVFAPVQALGLIIVD